MPRYRATTKTYVGEILRHNGDVFHSDAKIPSRSWVPIDDEGNDAPRYRAREECVVDGLVRQKGEEFHSLSEPSKAWLPVDGDRNLATESSREAVATATKPKAKTVKKGRREAPPGSTAAFLGQDVAAGLGEE